MIKPIVVTIMATRRVTPTTTTMYLALSFCVFGIRPEFSPPTPILLRVLLYFNRNLLHQSSGQKILFL